MADTVRVGPYEVYKEFRGIVRLCVNADIECRPGPYVNAGSRRFSDAGPAGGGCDIQHRVVWCDDLEPKDLLHEVMHVYLAVPRRTLERQPCEGRLLLPVERVVARHLLNEHDFQRAVDWQHETGLENKGSLPDVAETYQYWQSGLELGRKLGVLTANLKKPTLKTPDWSVLSRADHEYLKYRP